MTAAVCIRPLVSIDLALPTQHNNNAALLSKVSMFQITPLPSASQACHADAPATLYHRLLVLLQSRAAATACCLNQTNTAADCAATSVTLSGCCC